MRPQSEWKKEDWQEALKRVAGHLESFEDFIIPFLLARAQYCVNITAYSNGDSGYPEADNKNLLEIRLHECEVIDAKAGRYTAPEEVPFTDNLPGVKRDFERGDVDVFAGFELEPDNRVSLANDILGRYTVMIPRICRKGQDKQYGSSVENDIQTLRSIATRIHYGGMYVAECKFNICPEEFTALIEAKDLESIDAKLTRPEVEERIKERVKQKVIDIQKGRNPIFSHMVNPDSLVQFYNDTIIPLTKKGEIQYLLQKKLD